MDGPLYMDAEIRPNRSLSQRGFIILISVVTVFNCLAAAVFVSLGAHFAAVFLGLDVLAVAAAFLASFAAARRVERVTVDAADVRIVHETPRWSRLVWSSPTAFTRVSVVVEDERAVGLLLRLSGKEVAVAEALSPGERAAFAKALEQAIWRARNERG
ncbi:MAG: DUF2244 domain-containing protein [Phenylobacterium sp.]